MKPTTKYLLLSIVICLLVTGFCLRRFYPGSGVVSSIFFYAVTAGFTFLGVAILLVVLRFSKFITRHKFVYIFAAVGNLWLGLAAWLVWMTEDVRFGLVETFAPCLILGLLMIVDSFVAKSIR